MNKFQRFYTEITDLTLALKRIEDRIDEDVENIYGWASRTSREFSLSLDKVGTKISKEFIKSEIDRMTSAEKIVNLPAIIYGFLAAFIIVWVTGSYSVFLVQDMSKYIGLYQHFEAVQKLNLQSIFIIYSALGAAYFRDLAIRISVKRIRKLKMSLLMLEMMYVDKI
jgi:flagellar biosynthesis protein FlhB